MIDLLTGPDIERINDELRGLRAEFSAHFNALAWDRLRVLAWGEYLTKGRGAVFADFSAPYISPSGEVEVRGLFVEEARLLRCAAEWMMSLDFYADLYAEVMTYDPASQIVIVARYQDGALRQGVASLSPPPPVAFLKHISPPSLDLARAAQAAHNN
jgi:hypothetical protein